MYETQRLMRLGYPLSDAVSLANTLSRDGTLEQFIRREERKQIDEAKQALKFEEVFRYGRI